MNKLDKLVNDCKAMDITNQILTFGNSTLPNEAEAELEALCKENEQLRDEIKKVNKLIKAKALEIVNNDEIQDGWDGFNLLWQYAAKKTER